MISAPDTPSARRALELAIIGAFFLPGSAAHFAVAFSTVTKKLHADDIYKIWEKAKLDGDLPKILRPGGGPRDRIVVPIEKTKSA
jgi:hypothetical protein